jgi:hypothetical protein
MQRGIVADERYFYSFLPNPHQQFTSHNYFHDVQPYYRLNHLGDLSMIVHLLFFISSENCFNEQIDVNGEKWNEDKKDIFFYRQSKE